MENYGKKPLMDICSATKDSEIVWAALAQRSFDLYDCINLGVWMELGQSGSQLKTRR